MTSGGFDWLHPINSTKSYFGQKAATSATNSMGSAIGNASKYIPSLGKTGAKSSSPSNSLFSIIALVIVTGFIGIFFYYLYDKKASFSTGGISYDIFEKAIIVIALVGVGLGVSYGFKLNMIDFVLSSEINIIATFMLISYLGITSTIDSPWTSLLALVTNLGGILIHPTTIFSTGFKFIIPILFCIIPLLVLLYDFTQNFILALIVLAVTLAIVYVLYPKNNQNPIVGGDPSLLSFGGTTCVTSNWDYVNLFNWGKPHC